MHCLERTVIHVYVCERKNLPLENNFENKNCLRCYSNVFLITLI